MGFVVAIPSHRRVEILKKQTLAWLEKTNIHADAVHVVVSDEQDVAAYTGLGVRVVLPPSHPRSIVEKFNAIHNAWPVGTDVLVLEDDVTPITGANNKASVVTDAVAMAQQGFAAIPHGGIWGIAPHSNSMFFSGKVTRTLKLVVAHVFGFRTTHNPALEVTQLGKSDYERTCHYFVHYGETVRLDMYGVRTTSYTKPGGIAAAFDRATRAAHEAASCAHLVARYPHLLKLNTKKESLFQELSFLRCALTSDALREMQRILDRDGGFLTAAAPTMEPGWIRRLP